MQNLYRRPSGIWVARLVVPGRARCLVGRREFVQSTGTQDLTVAKLVASVLLSRWRRYLYDVERLARRAPMDNQHESILRIVDVSPALQGDGHMPLELAALESGLSVEHLLREASAGRLNLFSRLSGTAGYLVTVQALRARGGEENGGELDIPQPHQMPASALQIEARALYALPVEDVPSVVGALLASSDRATVVAFDSGRPGELFVPDESVKVNRSSVEVSLAEVRTLQAVLASGLSAEHIEAARAIKLASAHAPLAKAGKHAEKRFSDALAAYVRDYLPKKITDAKEIERLRVGIGLFIELRGDVKLSEVDGDMLRGFRDGPLSAVLARENHVRFKYGTSSMKESIAAVAGVGWPIMSAAERDQRMQWIARMFKWLQDQKWISDNPATGLRGESVLTKAQAAAEAKTKNPREPFSPSDLQAIFSSPWFKTGRGELTAAGKARRDFQPFQYWLPMLGLLCGCRIAEASQLWLNDVRKTESGVWFIDINEETGDKGLKTTWSVRKVPLHPKIIEAGFIDWCERLRAEGYQRLFPELSWNQKTQYAKEPIRSHTELFRGLGMPRNNTKVFHSFRRTLNTQLERLDGVSEVARKRIMGHQPGEGVNERHYLDDRTPDEAIEFMQRLDFKLPPIVPFDVDFGVLAVGDALRRKHGERRGKEDMGAAVPVIPEGSLSI